MGGGGFSLTILGFKSLCISHVHTSGQTRYLDNYDACSAGTQQKISFLFQEKKFLEKFVKFGSAKTMFTLIASHWKLCTSARDSRHTM